MKQKRYFDKFTIGFTVLFIAFIILLILSKLSKKVLDVTNLLIPSAQEKVMTTNDLIEQVSMGIITALVLYSVFCFYRFMTAANRGQLFSGLSQSLWKQISTIFIIAGVIRILLSFIDLKHAPFVLIYGLISSIAYSFSKIFKEAYLLKNENDLTV